MRPGGLGTSPLDLALLPGTPIALGHTSGSEARHELTFETKATATLGVALPPGPVFEVMRSLPPLYIHLSGREPPLLDAGPGPRFSHPCLGWHPLQVLFSR